MERRSVGGVWSAEGTQVMVLWHEGMLVRSREVVEVGHPIRCLLDAGDKKLWIGTDEGIFSYDAANEELRPCGKGLGTVTRMCLSKDGRCLYFISSEKGPGRVDIGSGAVRWLSKPSESMST